jgi:hypothetical protein
MATHRPERVVITDGRADHCDVAATRALTAIRRGRRGRRGRQAAGLTLAVLRAW